MSWKEYVSGKEKETQKTDYSCERNERSLRGADALSAGGHGWKEEK